MPLLVTLVISLFFFPSPALLSFTKWYDLGGISSLLLSRMEILAAFEPME